MCRASRREPRAGMAHRAGQWPTPPTLTVALIGIVLKRPQIFNPRGPLGVVIFLAYSLGNVVRLAEHL